MLRQMFSRLHFWHVYMRVCVCQHANVTCMFDGECSKNHVDFDEDEDKLNGVRRFVLWS